MHWPLRSFCIQQLPRTLKAVPLSSQAIQQIGHPMVPLRSEGHVSVCGTILAVVGRHHCLKLLEAMSCMHIFGFMSRLGCGSYISVIGHADRLACVGLLNYITRLDHASRLACISLARCRWSI